MRCRSVLPFASIVAALAGPAAAQSATQAIQIEIRPISRIAMSGTTTFTVSATKSAKASVVTAAASYAITTNEDNRRITVAIDEPMPVGVTLRMRMAAPAGAAAQDELTLSTEPQTAVTGISRLNAKDLGIDFALVTGDRAVIPAATTRTVKVTLVSGV
jgi:hypothetical protein